MFSNRPIPPSFERDELDRLLQAPMYAAIGTLLFEETDPVEFLHRLRRSAQIVVQSQQQQEKFGSLASVLSTFPGALGGESQLHQDDAICAKEYELLELLQQFDNADEGRARAIAHCAQVSKILAAKVDYAQAQAYCNWLLSVARSVAEALIQEQSALTDNTPDETHVKTVLAELKAALTVSRTNTEH